jgi:hypothetical protein
MGQRATSDLATYQAFASVGIESGTTATRIPGTTPRSAGGSSTSALKVTCAPIGVGPLPRRSQQGQRALCDRAGELE